jgi:hypothetical protein
MLLLVKIKLLQIPLWSWKKWRVMNQPRLSHRVLFAKRPSQRQAFFEYLNLWKLHKFRKVKGFPVEHPRSWAQIWKPFKEPRNRFPACWAGTTTLLFDVPGPQDFIGWLAESIPWNRFLGSLNVYKFRLCILNISVLCRWPSVCHPMVTLTQSVIFSHSKILKDVICKTFGDCPFNCAWKICWVCPFNSIFRCSGPSALRRCHLLLMQSFLQVSSTPLYTLFSKQTHFTLKNLACHFFLSSLFLFSSLFLTRYKAGISSRQILQPFMVDLQILMNSVQMYCKLHSRLEVFLARFSILYAIENEYKKGIAMG